MRQNTNYVLIGLFVVLGVIGIVGAMIFLGAGALRRDAVILETYLTESVQGLDVGAHVRFRGVRIGSVTEIGFTSEVYASEEPYVFVRMAIRPLAEGQSVDDIREIIDARLADGLRARLASQGLTGQLYLESDLYPDAETRYPPIAFPWEPVHRYVPSIPSTIVQFGDSAQRVLRSLESADVRGLVEDLRRVVNGLDGALQEANLGALARRFDGALERADATVERISSAVDRIGGTTEDLLAEARARVVAISPDDLTHLTRDLRTVASGLEPARQSLLDTLESSQSALDELRAMLRTKERDVDSALADVRRFASSLANLSATLERYPSLLLLGNPPPRTDR